MNAPATITADPYGPTILSVPAGYVPIGPTRDDRMRLAHLNGERHDYTACPVTWEDSLSRGLALDMADWIADEVARLYRLGLDHLARHADEVHYALIEFANRDDEDTRERERWAA